MSIFDLFDFVSGSYSKGASRGVPVDPRTDKGIDLTIEEEMKVATIHSVLHDVGQHWDCDVSGHRTQPTNSKGTKCVECGMTWDG